jgi:hypothetical protein
MATKQQTKVTGSTMSAYGRVGTAAELYKRIIAEFKLANVEWAAIVARQLMAAAACAAAPTPTAPRPVKRPTSPTTQWGRVGTAAECYKRLLTSLTYTTPDAEIHAQVAAEIGAGKAGPLSYVGWYRNWLLKRGHALPGAPVATAEVAS